jgi:hypothetical protein
VLASREVLVVVWLELVWLELVLVLVLVLDKCCFSISPTARNHQNEPAAKPPRERISALEMAIKANGNDNDNYNCSETHIRAQYPPHFTPARAGLPGWQLLDVRLSLRL